MSKDKIWRKRCRDGSFVEGVRHSGEHVHYDSSEGSDVPVSWRDEKTGEGTNLRKQGAGAVKKEGTMAKKKQLGTSMREVNKGTDDGISDVNKKKDESEKRVSDLEGILDAMSDLKGGVNQESIESMKKEAQEAFETQQREFEHASEDVHKQEKNLEERVETLSEGIEDKDADSKRAHDLSRSLKTDFSKKFISKIEQESQTESKEYKSQKKSLDSTIKATEKSMKDQERRAKKMPKFNI